MGINDEKIVHFCCSKSKLLFLFVVSRGVEMRCSSATVAPYLGSRQITIPNVPFQKEFCRSLLSGKKLSNIRRCEKSKQYLRTIVRESAMFL